MRTIHSIASIPFALLAVFGVFACASVASAAELRVRCEQRLPAARSRVSVDARSLPQLNAMYSARVLSGTAQATHVPLTAVGNEVEFDFDSDPADIAAGAQSIASNFIVGGTVQAAVFDANGVMVAGPTAAACRLRVPIRVR